MEPRIALIKIQYIDNKGVFHTAEFSENSLKEAYDYLDEMIKNSNKNSNS